MNGILLSEITPMDAIFTAIDGVVSLMTTVYNLFVANPFLLFLLAAELVPVGFEIFASAKRAAR